MKISVICVTNRRGYVPILKDDMDRQTFRDFEVIVGDDSLETGQPKEWKLVKPRSKNEGDVWNLNKAYNDCLDMAQGELLVFLQDYIWIPANGLQRFWDDYQMFPDSLITGVGNKAENGLKGISETDARMFGDDDFGPANHTHWELNWSSCPRRLMPRFNEEMDRYYGGENQYIAQQSGKEILIDRRNICIGYSQKECGGRPKDWEEKHSNKGALLKFVDSV